MKYRIGFNRGWRFTTDDIKEMPYEAYQLTKTGAQCNAAAVAFDDSKWLEVSLPHDYTVKGRLDPSQTDYTGYLERKNAWYRKYFYVDSKYENHHVELQFEGVSGESKIYVNGCLMKVNYSSYCGFCVDISDVIRFGQEVNVIAVHLDNHAIEGWWYQGGGIYRKAYMEISDTTYFDTRETIIVCGAVTEEGCSVSVRQEIQNMDETIQNIRVECSIFDPFGSEVYQEEKTIPAVYLNNKIEFVFQIEKPTMWDIGCGNMYCCRLRLTAGNSEDEITQTFGIRNIEYKTDGFYINGRKEKIKGFCYHEDEGNLGWAIDNLTYENRIKNLVAMGANAYRCSHNPPDPVVLELCDKYGILFVDEIRKFDSGELGLRELEYMIKRDRNHPSVILWSLGNEEAWQGESRGARIMKTLVARTKQLDPTRLVTMAMHDGFLENGAGCYSDVIGINYNYDQFDAVHERYPDKPILGTEENNMADHFQDGTLLLTGGEHAIKTLQAADERDYVIGTFGWAGQDYRGEHRNLAFFTNCCPVGCTGRRNDGFYQYQAHWSDFPVVHICGDWNENVLEEREVIIYANTEEVRLSLNGDIVAIKKPDAAKTVRIKTPFAPGVLLAEGLCQGRVVRSDKKETTGLPVKLILVEDETVLRADGTQRKFIEVQAVDDQGRICPSAAQNFHVFVSGPAEVVCTDNPDAYSTWRDSACDMNTYKGIGRIVLRAGDYPGNVTVQIKGELLEGSEISFAVLPGEVKELPAEPSPYINEWFVSRIFAEKPDMYKWPADDYYMHWQKYWEPSLVQGKSMPFYQRTGYVICCQEQDLPKVKAGHVPAIVFEKIAGVTDFLISARDYNNVIIKQLFYSKATPQAEKVRIVLPEFVSGDRMIIKAMIHGTNATDGIAGNVRFEL